ncbi:DUF6126 family protein [Kitasatospora misakiensis]|uniref:DUF6126 family protein n=1 Tax=Kitasatospora misakiensis TaxID=67330 RepID=A0ABW0X3L8_9ACTN
MSEYPRESGPAATPEEQTMSDEQAMPEARATLEEKARRRAMLIRAGVYIFATHLFAGFVLLLFALGDRK